MEPGECFQEGFLMCVFRVCDASRNPQGTPIESRCVREDYSHKSVRAAEPSSR
jgi:hypothetical protein